MPFLPEEIVFRIFLFLPAKVLHDVMRLVCRLWCKVIRDSAFTKAHLSESPENSPFGILIFGVSFELYSLNQEENTWKFKKRISQRYMMDGVGLILTVDRNYPSVIYILNPITNQILTLPEKPTKYSIFSRDWAVGYSPSISKYKVVCIDKYSRRAYILTVGVDKKWREILVEADKMTRIIVCSEYFNPQGIWGSINWYNHDEKYGIVLDLEEETFYKIDFFKEIDGVTSKAKLIKSDKILSIAIKEKHKCWHFWELVDYKNGGEWRKLGSFEFESNLSEIMKIEGVEGKVRNSPLVLKNRDEALFWCYDKSRLFSYNFNSETVSRSTFNNKLCTELMLTNSLVLL